MSTRFAQYVDSIKQDDSLNDLLEKENRSIPDRLKIIAYAFKHGKSADETNKLLYENHEEILYVRNIYDALLKVALDHRWSLKELEEAANLVPECSAKYAEFTAQKDKDIETTIKKILSGGVSNVQQFEKICDDNEEHFINSGSQTASLFELQSKFTKFCKSLDAKTSMMDTANSKSRVISKRYKIIAYCLLHEYSSKRTNEVLQKYNENELNPGVALCDALICTALDNKWKFEDISKAAYVAEHIDKLDCRASFLEDASKVAGFKEFVEQVVNFTGDSIKMDPEIEAQSIFTKYVEPMHSDISLNALLSKDKKFPTRLKIIAFSYMHQCNSDDVNILLRENQQKELFVRDIYDLLFTCALDNNWSLEEIVQAADCASRIEKNLSKKETKFVSESYLKAVVDRCVDKNSGMKTTTESIQDQLLATGNVIDVASFKTFLVENMEYFTNFRTRTVSVLAEKLRDFMVVYKEHRDDIRRELKRVYDVEEDFLTKEGLLNLQAFYAGADSFFGAMLSEIFFREQNYNKHKHKKHDDEYIFIDQDSDDSEEMFEKHFEENLEEYIDRHSDEYKKIFSTFVNGVLNGEKDINRDLFLITLAYIDFIKTLCEPQIKPLTIKTVNESLKICGWYTIDENVKFDAFIKSHIANGKRFTIREKEMYEKEFIFFTQNYLVTRNNTIQNSLLMQKTKEGTNNDKRKTKTSRQRKTSM